MLLINLCYFVFGGEKKNRNKQAYTLVMFFSEWRTMHISCVIISKKYKS